MIDSSADLIGRLPSMRSYEPLLVTTLRTYHRLRAPASLLQRLAGGPAHWHRLNAQWAIDGVLRVGPRPAERPRAPELDPVVLQISGDERIIMLGQFVREFLAAGEAVPMHRLRQWFAISDNQLRRDLSDLRQRGVVPSPLPTVDSDEN